MKKFIDALGILAAAVAIWIAQWIRGLLGGFAYGTWKMSDFVYTFPNADGTRSDLRVSHIDPYGGFDHLSYLSIAVLIYILFKLLERGLWTSLLTLLPLATAILLWFQAEAVRNGYSQDPHKYLDPMRDVSAASEMLFALFIFLAIVQLTSIILYLRDSRAARPR